MVKTHERQEGWQHDCHLESHIDENEIMNGSIKIKEYPLKTEYSKGESAKKSILFLRSKRGKHAIHRAVLGIAVVSLILNLILIALSGRRCETCLAPLPLFPEDPCPNSWIGFQKKCYYFSEAEGSWTFSNLYCASHNASLAVIESQEEMSFLLRYKSLPDHWIGLQRDNPEQPWRWINGTISHEWLTVHGEGWCAYINHKIIASSSCMREEHWICSKPAERWHRVTA